MKNIYKRALAMCVALLLTLPAWAEEPLEVLEAGIVPETASECVEIGIEEAEAAEIGDELFESAPVSEAEQSEPTEETAALPTQDEAYVDPVAESEGDGKYAAEISETEVDAVPTVEEAAPAVAPEAMPYVEVRSGGKTALELSWTAVDGAEGYDVFYAGADGDFPEDPAYTVPSGGVLFHRIEGLKKGIVYKVRVMAWQNRGGAKVYAGRESPTAYALTGGFSRTWCNPGKITVDSEFISLSKGQTGKISASVKGVKKGRKVLKRDGLLRYYSGDSAVATVDGSGVIHAVGKGYCEVIAMASNGLRAKVMVLVDDVQGGIVPNAISFAKKKTLVIKTGGTLNLAARLRITPAGAATTIEWSSSHPHVASVDEGGMLRGLQAGRTTVTAVTADGKKASVKIRVKKNNTVVFFGDSLTQWGPWKTYFKGMKVHNMGYASDTLSRMNDRVATVAAKEPAKVFIMGGINSLLNEPWEVALAEYTALLDNVKGMMPDVQVYVLSMLPVGASRETTFCTNADIVRFNERLQTLAAERGFQYIDIYQYYVKNGEMNSALSRDGVHLKNKAYQYWRNAIRRYVTK